MSKETMLSLFFLRNNSSSNTYCALHIFLFILVVAHHVVTVPLAEGSLLPSFLQQDPPRRGGRGGSLLTELLWPMSASHRDHDPFRVLEQIPLALERDELVDDMMNIISTSCRVDWKETPNAHFIMLDLPGLEKEELKIEVVENRVLRVSGEREKEEEKKGDHWHRVERSYGKFWRQFRLPDNVDLDSVKAKLENGVLTITLAKLSPEKIKGPKVVPIDTSTTNTGSHVGITGGGGEEGGSGHEKKITVGDKVDDLKQEL